MPPVRDARHETTTSYVFVEGAGSDGVDGADGAKLDGGVGEHRRGARRVRLAADPGLGADERGDVVALRAELADDELADVPRAADDEHLGVLVLLGKIGDGRSGGEVADRFVGRAALEVFAPRTTGAARRVARDEGAAAILVGGVGVRSFGNARGSGDGVMVVDAATG